MVQKRQNNFSTNCCQLLMLSSLGHQIIPTNVLHEASFAHIYFTCCLSLHGLKWSPFFGAKVLVFLLSLLETSYQLAICTSLLAYLSLNSPSSYFWRHWISFYFFNVFQLSQSYIIMEISLDFKQGFVFKYALSLTCLAIAPHVLYRSVAFQRWREAHCFQQNLGQVITCHFFTLFCSSRGKKKIWGWERQHLYGTKVPMLSHSVICFFTHAECLTLPEGCCRLVALCVQWQDSVSLCAAMRYQCTGTASSI